jgi:hypothetical protein
MTFVVSCFGNLYFQFLAVCLASIRDTHPGSPIRVLYDDMDEGPIERLRKVTPGSSFQRLDILAASQRRHATRAAGKLDHWVAVLTDLPDGEIAIFVDVDMVVRKPLTLERHFDLLFTWQPRRFHLNTGFIAVRTSERVRSFMRCWRDASAKIMADEDLHRQAKTENGAADQHSLFNLMGGAEALREAVTRRTFPFGSIDFYGARCDELNETRSVPLNSPAKVLHYKGEWHLILLEGRSFTKHRPRNTSLPMLRDFSRRRKAAYKEIGLRPPTWLELWARARINRVMGGIRAIE